MNIRNRLQNLNTDKEIYKELLKICEEKSCERKKTDGTKKVYYISAEFLLGKLLSNNLINLGIYDEVNRVLNEKGKSIAQIEDEEPEMSLGNGGLGRLAACFLDSIATLGLNGSGIGLRYHFGLFRQKFENNLQTEYPDFWIENENWLTKTDTTYKIEFNNKSVISRLYTMNVTGYDNHTNTLNLFDIESVDESLVKSGIEFDKSDIEKNLTLFLYPDDSTESGRLLRIYQQYLMVSSGARLILDECTAKGCNLHNLAEYAVVQINDTHPTMIIPELIRLLTERGIGMDEAIEIVGRTCAYTNHTILAEALEKWSLDSLKKTVPQLVPIIQELDSRVKAKYKNENVHIIDKQQKVHMARIDIHYTFSVNGVASLHTDILKNTELNEFYKLYPERFNNKTNGITFRRWLLHCNPMLAEFIEFLIGDGFKKNALELEKLVEYKNNEEVLRKLFDIKQKNKKSLTEFIQKTSGIEINENSIFDIQIKRLHEYKRQQLNALYVINKYFEIKSGKKPTTPITVIFGAKAAPAYTIAKDIIHLILCLQELINKDSEANQYLKVIMIENYNVTKAEKLIPACDISEQISLASKEASGTGNMKFMLNGAVTLGTEDGANVEIHKFVGDENIYIIGDSSETVVKRYKDGSYNAEEYYKKNDKIRRAVDFITSKELVSIGCKENLERLKKELITKDWFMTFPDFDDYAAKRDKAYKDYENRLEWAKKMLVNISYAGYFSSDRTIEEYNRDIWKLI